MADQVWLPLRQLPLCGVTYQSTCVFPGRLSEIHIWLVVRFNHPEKIWVKWDGYIPYMMGKKNQWFQTTNQTSMCIMLLMKFSTCSSHWYTKMCTTFFPLDSKKYARVEFWNKNMYGGLWPPTLSQVNRTHSNPITSIFVTTVASAASA